MMAANKARKRKIKFHGIHRLAAAVALLSLMVIAAAGLIAEARVSTIVYRSLGAIMVVVLVTRFIVRILADYEEMNSGKA
jgi:hypothetical protein